MLHSAGALGGIGIVGPGRARRVDSSCRKCPKISSKTDSLTRLDFCRAVPCLISSLNTAFKWLFDGGSY